MGAITTAVIGLAGSAVAARQARSQQRSTEALTREGIEAADPFREFRPAHAAALNALVADPSSVTGTASYRARLQAAERTMAAQGYTGSGNALVEAANAGGAAYQQEFENLAMLSGASTKPGGGYETAVAGRQFAQTTSNSATQSMFQNLAGLASAWRTSRGP